MFNSKNFFENKSAKIILVLGTAIGGGLGYYFIKWDLSSLNNISNIIAFVVIGASYLFGAGFLFLGKNRKNLYEISKLTEVLDEIFENKKSISESIVILEKEINNYEKSSKVKKLWQAYKESFITLSDDGEKKHQTVDADYFFNEETLLKEEMKYKVYMYLPQLFLGIGIFGTFIGLAMGLKGLDFTNGNTETIKESVKNLLGGVEVSFYTSVFGIYFSIIFSVITNFYFEYYEKKILQLKNGLNEKFIRNKNEDLLLEVNEKLEKIRVSNDELAHKLANELGEKLGDLTENIAVVMNNFTDKVGGDLGHHIEESINKLFNEGIIESFDRVAGQLVNTLEKSHEHSENFPVLMGQISQQFENSKKTITEMNNCNTELYETATKKITESLDETIAKITDTFMSTNNNIKNVADEIISNFDETNTKIESTSLKINDIFNVLKITNDEALLLAREIKEIFEQKDSFKNISDIFNQVQQIAEVLQNKMNSEIELKNMWMTFGQEFKETNSNLVESFVNYREEITNGTNEFREIIKEFHRTYEDSIKKQTIDYSQTVASGTAGIFQEYDKNISDVVNKFHGVLRSLDEKLGTLELIMKENKESLNDYLEKICTLNKEKENNK
ncbi:MAG: anti-phage defense ZorAB system ZorA [Leptotrichiaceae bacterium]|nr:anti-phage defense ZorAB system ZorA [Leptotrichiaceae bacterium]